MDYTNEKVTIGQVEETFNHVVSTLTNLEDDVLCQLERFQGVQLSEKNMSEISQEVAEGIQEHIFDKVIEGMRTILESQSIINSIDANVEMKEKARGVIKLALEEL